MTTLVGFVFTFGPNHRHPITGEPLARRFVTLPGTLDQSRAAMMALFGARWAHQYPSEDQAGVAKYGLEPLDVQPLVDLARNRARLVWRVDRRRFDEGELFHARALATNWLDVEAIESPGDPGFVARLVLNLCDEIEAVRQELKARPTTVHRLRHGTAVCGAGMPERWARGELWAHRWQDVTCPDCLAAEREGAVVAWRPGAELPDVAADEWTADGLGIEGRELVQTLVMALPLAGEIGQLTLTGWRRKPGAEKCAIARVVVNTAEARAWVRGD